MSTVVASYPYLFAGLSTLDPLDSSCIESTTAGTFDPTWATYSLSVGIGSSGKSPTLPLAANFWARFFFTTGAPAAGSPVNTVAQLLHTGTVVAQLTETHTGGLSSFALQTLQAGVMTTVGSFTRSAALNPFDINVVGGAGGSAALYSNGTLVVSASGLNHTAWAGVDQIVLGGPPSGYSTPNFFSEGVCDTKSTTGRRLKYVTLNTVSTVNTGWVPPTPGNIDEIPTNDSTYISAAAANLVSTFFQNGLSLGTNVILAVGVGARVRADAGGPQNVQLAIRSGGSTFFSPTAAAGPGFQAAFNSWVTDPNTSLAWTTAAAAGAEEGVKSIT